MSSSPESAAQAPAIHLHGKVAIITGGSRGIGEATARMFAAHGAKVVVASRKADACERVAAEIVAQGGEAFGMACHGGKTEDVHALVAATIDRFGQVDVLVNNAATNPHFGPLVTVDAGAWQKTFEVNLQGYFEASRAVAQHLTARHAKGSIINVTSIAGLGSAVLQGLYGMTKAAVISMTQTMAAELGPSGIRVNAIAPGLVQTRFAKVLIESEDILKHFTERAALRRYAVPEEIAPALLYLASDASSFVTGTTLVVDGGYRVG